MVLVGIEGQTLHWFPTTFCLLLLQPLWNDCVEYKNGEYIESGKITDAKLLTTQRWDLPIFCLLFCISMDRGSPDSTNFGPPGDCTIAKIVLSGD